MRERLLLPLALLALGLAAAGGFFAAAAALSEGGGGEGVGLQTALRAADEAGEMAPPRLVGRGFAGLVLAEEPDDGGVRIMEVLPGSAADEAGLRESDIITAVDGDAVETVGAVRTAIVRKEPGDRIRFSVRRDGQEQDIAVILGARPGFPREPAEAPIEVPRPGKDRPYLGVRLADITPEIREELDLARGDGVAVVSVAKRSPADGAGLRRGDVILMIGLRRVQFVEEVQDAILDHEPGEAVRLLIRRGAQELQMEVELGARRGLGPPLEMTPGHPRSWESLPSLLTELDLDLDLDLPDPAGLFERFVGADIVILDRRGQHVELHLTAGVLIEMGDGEIRLAPHGFSGIDRRFSVTEETRVFVTVPGGDLDDLWPGDGVLVLTRDDSDEALVILSPLFAWGRHRGVLPVPVTPEMLLPFPDVQ